MDDFGNTISKCILRIFFEIVQPCCHISSPKRCTDLMREVNGSMVLDPTTAELVIITFIRMKNCAKHDINNLQVEPVKYVPDSVGISKVTT